MSDSYFYTLSLIHPDEEWKLRPHLEVIHIAIGVRALMHVLYVYKCMYVLSLHAVRQNTKISSLFYLLETTRVRLG